MQSLYLLQFILQTQRSGFNCTGKLSDWQSLHFNLRNAPPYSSTIISVFYLFSYRSSNFVIMILHSFYYNFLFCYYKKIFYYYNFSFQCNQLIFFRLSRRYNLVIYIPQMLVLYVCFCIWLVLVFGQVRFLQFLSIDMGSERQKTEL